MSQPPANPATNLSKGQALIVHSLIVLLALVTGIIGFADKVAALSFIPANFTKYWPLILSAAVAVKPIVLMIGDIMDDGVINQSFGKAVSTILLIIGAGGVATGLVACLNTSTGNPVKDQRNRVINQVATEAGTVAWDFALSSGMNYLKGQNGQDAASAAFAAAKDTLVSYDAAAGISRIRAAAGPAVARAAESAIATANPQTPVQTRAAFNSIGAAFQSASNATIPPSNGNP